MNRRSTLLALAAMTAAGTIRPALAADWPASPVRFVIPFPAGGAGDVVPRLIAQHLGPKWGQPVVVENRPGADGIIGVDVVAKSQPNGYTVGVATSGPVAVGKALFPGLPYDPVADLAPVILTYETPFVLVVPAASPYKSLADLFEAAKARPGRLNVAIPNSGSVQHLLTEQMKSDNGLDIANIPYKGGGPAATAVAAGEVDMTWGALPNVVGLLQAGRMRAIAVSSAQRAALLPEVPTVGEQGQPRLVSTNWNGLIVPRRTPEAVVEKMNADINAILAMPAVIKQFQDMGVTPLGGSRAAFAKLLKDEGQKWGRVIRARGIKVV